MSGWLVTLPLPSVEVAEIKREPILLQRKKKRKRKERDKKKRRDQSERRDVEGGEGGPSTRDRTLIESVICTACDPAS